jgi:hypothetical protein
LTGAEVVDAAIQKHEEINFGSVQREEEETRISVLKAPTVEEKYSRVGLKLFGRPDDVWLSHQMGLRSVRARSSMAVALLRFIPS